MSGTLYWVFYMGVLHTTFNRGFSAGEVPQGAYIYHVSGQWKAVLYTKFFNLRTEQVPTEVRALALLLL